MSYVGQLASGMHDYAPQDVLRGPYIMSRYDQVMINGLLQKITASNVLITLTDESVVTDEVSPYYEVPYSRQVLAGEQLAVLERPVEPEPFRLPPVNEFIAQNVALVPLPDDQPDHPFVALQEARQRIGEHGLYVVADIANLPFKPEAFEGTVSLHTIHHLPEDEHLQAYRELYRTLAVGCAATVVNGWPTSSLMRFFRPMMQWSNRIRNLKNRLLRRSLDVEKPTKEVSPQKEDRKPWKAARDNGFNRVSNGYRHKLP